MFATNLLPRLPNNPLGKMYARAAVMNVENIGESSYFPVRSQHQKNNQQRQAMKINQVQLQMQKQSQVHSNSHGAIQGHRPNGINLAMLTPQQRQQLFLRQQQQQQLLHYNRKLLNT